MVNQSSIKYISSLLSNPETITSGDQSSIALFRQTFPYFVPVRYLAAVEKSKQAQLSNEMLSEIQPYLGDWMLFCDFLEAGARARDKVLDKKKVDVSPLPTHSATASTSTTPTSFSDEPAVTETPKPVLPTEEKKKAEPVIAKTDEHTGKTQDQPSFKPDMPLPAIELLGVHDVIFTEVAEEVVLPAADLNAEKTPEPATTKEPMAIETPVATADPEPVAIEQPVVILTETVIGQEPGIVAPDAAAQPVTAPIAPANTEVTLEQVAEMPAPEAMAEITVPPAAEQPDAVAKIKVEEPALDGVAEVPQSAAEPKEKEPAEDVVDAEEVAVSPENITAVETEQKHIEIEEAEVAPAAETEDAPADIITHPIPTLDVASSKDPLISPVYTQDYFLQQGEKISEILPQEFDGAAEDEDEDKSLMVMMSFSEWLLHFKNTSEKQQEEKKDQKALKTMWQKEKLAAAMEEENEEIPESVFQMAVDSITREEDLASEPLANIYIKQGRYDQAIEMYRKLSLRNPQKSAYFARKIEEIQKDKS